MLLASVIACVGFVADARSELLLFGCFPAGPSGAGAGLLPSCRGGPWWISCRVGDGPSRFHKPSCLSVRRPLRGDGASFLPLAGRGGEGEEEGDAAAGFGWRRRDSAATRSSSSTVQDWPSTLKANRWLCSTPAMVAGVSSTSMRRPSEGLAVALLFFPVSSGAVPGTVEEGHGGGSLCYDGAVGPDCVLKFRSRVLCAKLKDCSVIFLLLGILSVTCISTTGI